MASKNEELGNNAEKTRDKYREVFEELQKIHNEIKFVVKETESFQKAVENLNKQFGFTLIHTKQVEKSFEEQYEDFKKVYELQKKRNELEKIFLDDLNKSIYDAIVNELQKNTFLLEEQKNISKSINETVKTSEDVTKNFQSISKKMGEVSTEIISSQENIAQNISEKSEKDIIKNIEMYEELSSKIIDTKQNMAQLYDAIKDNQSEYLDVIKSNLKNLDESNKEYFSNLIKHINKINNLKTNRGGLWGESKKEFFEAITFLKEQNLLTEDQLKKLTEILKINKQITETEKKLSETTKTLNKIYAANAITDFVESKIGFNFINELTEIDSSLSKLRSTSSILLKDMNSIKLSEYLMDLSQFNIGIKEATENLMAFSDVLKSTNVGVLTKLTKQFAAVEMALGVSGKHTATLVGELTKSNIESNKIKQTLEKTNQTTKILGLNTRVVVENLSEAVVKMRQLGWTSVEAMKNLTIFAERYRISMSEIYSMAEKTRSLEGSIEAAAKLQLAGGLGTYFDPIQLLSAARKGGEELENVIKKIGNDIGRFNEEGEFIFDAVDVDRLKIIADAVGMSLDALQEKIRKNAEINRKLKFLPDISFEGIIGPDGKPMKPEDVQSWIAESIGQRGEILEGSALDMAGIKDLSKMTKEDIQKAFDLKKKTLEEEAAINKSFNDSVESLKKAVKSLVATFEPFIKVLTRLIDFLSKQKAFVVLLGLVGASRLLVPLISNLLKALSVSQLKLLNVKKFFKIEDILPNKEEAAGGAASKIPAKNIFQKVGKFFGFKTNIKTPGIVPEGSGDIGKEIQKTEKMTKAAENMSKSVSSVPSGISKKSTEVSTGLRRLSGGFSSFGKRVTENDIRKVRQAAFALALFTLATPAIFMLALAGKMGGLISSGFRSIARGISSFGNNPTKMAKGLIMLGLTALVLGAMTAALVLFGGISWKDVLIGIGVMTLLAAMFVALGAIFSNPAALAFFTIGLIAMTAMSLVIAAFAAGLYILSLSLKSLEQINYVKIFSGLKDLASSFSSLFSFGLFDMISLNLSLNMLSKSLSKLEDISSGFGNSANNLSRFNSSLQDFITLIRAIKDEDIEKLNELSKASFNKELKVVLEDRREKQPINVQITLPGGRVIYEEIIKDIERKS